MQKLMKLAVGSLCLFAVGSQTAVAAPAALPNTDDVAIDPTTGWMEESDFEYLYAEYTTRYNICTTQYITYEAYNTLFVTYLDKVNSQVKALLADSYQPALEFYTSSVGSNDFAKAAQNLDTVIREFQKICDDFVHSCKIYEGIHYSYSQTKGEAQILLSLMEMAMKDFAREDYPNVSDDILQAFKDYQQKLGEEMQVDSNQLRYIINDCDARMANATSIADLEDLLQYFNNEVSRYHERYNNNQQLFKERWDELCQQSSPSDADQQQLAEWEYRLEEIRQNIASFEAYVDGCRQSYVATDETYDYYDALFTAAQSETARAYEEYDHLTAILKEAFGSSSKDSFEQLQEDYARMKVLIDRMRADFANAWGNVNLCTGFLSNVSDTQRQLNSFIEDVNMFMARQDMANARPRLAPYSEKAQQYITECKLLRKQIDDAYRAGTIENRANDLSNDIYALQTSVTTLTDSYKTTRRELLQTINPVYALVVEYDEWMDVYTEFLSELKLFEAVGNDIDAYIKLRDETFSKAYAICDEHDARKDRMVKEGTDGFANRQEYYIQGLAEDYANLNALKAEFAAACEGLKQSGQYESMEEMANVATARKTSLIAQIDDFVSELRQNYLADNDPMLNDILSQIVTYAYDVRYRAEGVSTTLEAFESMGAAQNALGYLSYLSDEFATRSQQFRDDWKKAKDVALMREELQTLCNEYLIKVQEFGNRVNSRQEVPGDTAFLECKGKAQSVAKEASYYFAVTARSLWDETLTIDALNALYAETLSMRDWFEAAQVEYEETWRNLLSNYGNSTGVDYLKFVDKVNAHIAAIEARMRELSYIADTEEDDTRREAASILFNQLNKMRDEFHTLLNEVETYNQDGTITDDALWKFDQRYVQYVSEQDRLEALYMATLDGTMDGQLSYEEMERNLTDLYMRIKVMGDDYTYRITSLPVPASVANTPVESFFDRYRTAALDGISSIYASIKLVEGNLREFLSTGKAEEQQYNDIMQNLYILQNRLDATLTEVTEQWNSVSVKAGEYLATQADLNALEAQITAAIADLRARLEEIQSSYQSAPRRIDGDAPSIVEILEESIAAYEVYLTQVQEAKRNIENIADKLADAEFFNVSTFAPVAVSKNNLNNVREEFTHKRQLVMIKVEEAMGQPLDFNVDVFRSTRNMLRGEIDQFVLYLNDNLMTRGGFSAEPCVQQAKGTPIYDLFWRMNNEAQTEYIALYSEPAMNLEVESETRITDDTIDYFADGFLKELYNLRDAARHYEATFMDKLSTNGERYWEYMSTLDALSCLEKQQEVNAIYFANVRIDVGESQADLLEKLLMEARAKVSSNDARISELKTKLQYPESFDEVRQLSLQVRQLSADVYDCITRFEDQCRQYSDFGGAELDRSVLWDAIYDARTAIDAFLIYLNNDYFMPEDIAPLVRDELGRLNNDAQTEYHKRFSAPAVDIEIEAQKALANDEIIDLITRVANLKAEAADYVEKYFQPEYKRLIELGYNIVQLQQEVLALNQNVQTSAAEAERYYLTVVEMEFDDDTKRETLMNATAKYYKGMDRIRGAAENLVYLVSTAADPQALQYYTSLKDNIQEEYDTLQKEFFAAWEQATGSLPEGVATDLYAEFTESYYAATALADRCEKLLLSLIDTMGDHPSPYVAENVRKGVEHNVIPACQMLADIMSRAMEAHHSGKFNRQYLEESNMVMELLTKTMQQADALLAAVDVYRKVLKMFDQTKSDIEELIAQVQEVAAENTDLAMEKTALLDRLYAMNAEVQDKETEMDICWISDGNPAETLQPYLSMFADVQAAYENIKAEAEAMAKTLDQNGMNGYEVLMADAQALRAKMEAVCATLFTPELEERYNADGLNRCETFETIRADFEQGYNRCLMMLAAAMEEINQAYHAGTLMLDAPDLETRLWSVQATFEKYVYDFEASMKMKYDELEAERALRYGLVADTTEDGDMLYLNTYVVNAGANVSVPLKLKNEDRVRSISFDLCVPDEMVALLPTAMTMVSVECDAARAAGFKVSVAQGTTRGMLSVTLSSNWGSCIAAGDGAVLNVVLRYLPEGDYPIMLQNVQIMRADGKVTTAEKVLGNVRAVTVDSFGDTTSSTGHDVVTEVASSIATNAVVVDGSVDKTELTKYDVTGDGKVTVSDITTVIRLLGEKNK